MAPVHSSFLASACNILVLSSNLVLVQEPRYHHVQKESDFHCWQHWVLSNNHYFHLYNSLFLSFQHSSVSKNWSNFRGLSHHCGMLMSSNPKEHAQLLAWIIPGVPDSGSCLPAALLLDSLCLVPAKHGLWAQPGLGPSRKKFLLFTVGQSFWPIALCNGIIAPLATISPSA